jgi:hypothetical protein
MIAIRKKGSYFLNMKADGCLSSPTGMPAKRTLDTHLGYFACYLKKRKKDCDVIVDAPELSHRDGLPCQLARLVHRVLKKRDNHIS